LIILHIITGLNDGGAEACLYRLCTNDKSNKHIVISLLDQGKYGSLLLDKHIKTHFLNLKLNLSAIISIFRLCYYLNKYNPDVIQSWMYHADFFSTLVSLILGKNNIVWGIRHSSLMPGKSKVSTIWISWLLARMSHIFSKKIISCAFNAIDVHKNLGYDSTKMVCIPNGYDLSNFQYIEGRLNKFLKKLNLNTALPILGSVGRYDPQKDHSNLLRALSIIRRNGVEFYCLLIGQGLDQGNTRIIAEIEKLELDKSVLLLGSISNIPEVMSALDLHISSSSFGEAFPNVVAESMACSTPCIVTNVGDAPLIVGDTGWVVPPCNSESLANVIAVAIEEMNSDRWEERRTRSRSRIEKNFSISHMVANFHKVWKKIPEM
jgi:glycosyltransferase involved in cell wall biosynthesis